MTNEQQADGEYISRKALLEDLYKRDYTKFTHRDFVALVQYQDIVAIPPAEPKTGHWILQPSNKEQGERDFIWWKCSECGQVIYSETEKDRREYHAFCGRCGARMVEPQEISYTVEQELNEYTGNIEIIEKKY